MHGVKVNFSLRIAYILSPMIFLGGATHDPCDDIYCGSKAFSEVETQHVSNFISAHSDTIVHYINFHSYSQLWMTPWGNYAYGFSFVLFFLL
jgi:hypothetical protein